MKDVIKDYSKFLNAKLYMIEHLITPILLKSSSKEEMEIVLKEIRKVCYEGYEQFLRRYQDMSIIHKGELDA